MALLINNETNIDYDFTDVFNNVLNFTKTKLKISKDYDLSVSFVDDKAIRNINKDYRNIDKTTDVISFAMLDNYDLVGHDDSDLDLGDIFISVDTAKKQAQTLNQSLNEEVLFLFIHGLLHLLGYDHTKQSEEKTMFKLQREILDEVVKENHFKI